MESIEVLVKSCVTHKHFYGKEMCSSIPRVLYKTFRSRDSFRGFTK